MGRAVCYSDIATKIKSPKASRAVGAPIIYRLNPDATVESMVDLAA
jgi:alkylated DNA nucleotide flippase Atl1